MINVTEINNQIDLLIDANKYFMVKCDVVKSENALYKLNDFMSYAMKSNKYKVIFASYGESYVFIFVPGKANKAENEVIYKIFDKIMDKNEIVNIEIAEINGDGNVSSKKYDAKSKNEKIRKVNDVQMKDESEQWFNEM